MRTLPGSCAGSGYIATGCGKIKLSSGSALLLFSETDLVHRGTGQALNCPSVMMVVVY